MIIGITGILVYRIAKSRRSGLTKNRKISESIFNKFFANDTHYYLSLLSSKELGDELHVEESELDIKLMQEMKYFKPLLHPVKISIFKILNEQTRMKSTDLIKILNINWSEYHSAVLKLQKMELVKVMDGFDNDGYKSIFIEITPNGEKEYRRLLEVIQQFISNANDQFASMDRETLYPQN